MTLSNATMNPLEERQKPLEKVMSRSFTLNGMVIAWIAIFVLAMFTRFYILGDRVMSHDESLHTRFSYNLYNEGNFQHTPLMPWPDFVPCDGLLLLRVWR